MLLLTFVNEAGGCDVVGATNAEAEPAAAKELAMHNALNFMFSREFLGKRMVDGSDEGLQGQSLPSQHGAMLNPAIFRAFVSMADKVIRYPYET